MSHSDDGTQAGPLDLEQALRRLEPLLRLFIAGELPFDEFSREFESQYERDADRYDSRAGDVLGIFFTDCDQTAEAPDPKFYEITVGELQARARAVLAEARLVE